MPEKANDAIQSRAAEVFRQNRWDDVRRRATHLDWEDVSRLGTRLLSGLLGRRIEAELIREDYYYWGLSVKEDPISIEECEALIEVLEGSEYDRAANIGMEAPIHALDQSLCCRLFGKILPFDVGTSLADDEGVWFLSDAEK